MYKESTSGGRPRKAAQQSTRKSAKLTACPPSWSGANRAILSQTSGPLPKALASLQVSVILPCRDEAPALWTRLFWCCLRRPCQGDSGGAVKVRAPIPVTKSAQGETLIVANPDGQPDSAGIRLLLRRYRQGFDRVFSAHRTDL